MTVAPAQRASWMAAFADRPGPSGDQDGAVPERTRLEPGRAVLGNRQRAVGGHPRDSDARPEFEVRAVREPEGTFGRHDRVLLGGSACRAPVRGQRHPDAVAGLDAGDARSHGVDDPGAVVVGNLGSPVALPKAPLRDFQSVGLTPDTTTRIRTSPSAGSASGRSTTFRTDASPVLA
jgi:hypothetical protein